MKRLENRGEHKKNLAKMPLKIGTPRLDLVNLYLEG